MFKPHLLCVVVGLLLLPLSTSAEGADPIAALYARLTPEGKRQLGVPPERLRPEGYELARAFLKPIAEQGGLIPRDELERQLQRVPANKAIIDHVLNNRIQLLGGMERQELGQPIDWFRAPRGDLQWPTHLSRHYWLLPAGYAYRATGEARYAQHIADVLLDWTAKFPHGAPTLHNATSGRDRTRPGANTTEGYFKGYVDGPWTSLSAHIRLDNWTKLFQLTWDSPAMTNATVATLLNSLVDEHRRVMLDFPRSMNQFQGIATSLVWMGIFYSSFEGSAEAERVGWERLERYATREIYPDGSVAECSPNYGMSCTLRLFDLIGEGARFGRAVPPVLGERVRLAARYYALTADPLGRSPRLAKGGGDVTGALARMNARLNDPEIAFIASRGRQGTAPATLCASFPWAGHHAFRSGWDAQATWMLFDAGPRGTGHHDAAQLGVQLIAHGEWLLTDPGYYSYSTAGEEGRISAYLRSTAAHNTAIVDGQGQISRPPNTRADANTAPGDCRWSDAPTRASAEGAYTNGYGKDGQIKVTHHRRVEYLKTENAFIITDTFAADAADTTARRIDLHWQLPPKAAVEVAGGSAVVTAQRSRMMLAFSAGTPLRIATFEGQKDPLAGWYSETYGRLGPAPMVQVAAEAPLPLEIRTRIEVGRR